MIKSFFLYQVDLVAGLFGGSIQRLMVVSATARKILCVPDPDRGASFAQLQPELCQGALDSDDLLVITVMYYNYIFIKARLIVDGSKLESYIYSLRGVAVQVHSSSIVQVQAKHSL